MAAVYVYTIGLTLVGPERRGRNLNVEHDRDMQDATGNRAIHAGQDQRTEQVGEKGVRNESEIA